VIDRADPQVFAMVFSETDHASHRWWLEGDPPQELIDVYDLVDATMGGLIKDLVREDDTVLVVSDHGSWPVHHLIHLIPLLAVGGFLAPAPRGAASAMPRPPRTRPASRLNANEGGTARIMSTRLDWPNTRAFPLGDHVIVTGIYVNRPPFPFPAVDDDEYEDVRTKVAALLQQVEDPVDGRPAFSTAAPPEEVYQGAALGLAPDLIVDGVPGCSPHLGRFLKAADLFSEVRIGGHRREGMYAVNTPIELDEVEPIEGLLPKVLGALAFDLPETSDQTMPDAYSAEQAKEIEDRLRDLGYME
jgi:predicted AlkP superfamily phosphohydrolase/phosphomutase